LIKATTVLLADQIRREDNGKALIIGVYTGDVLLGAIPSVMPFALWLELEFSGASLSPQLDLELRVRVVGKDKSADYETHQKYHIALQGNVQQNRIKSVLVINGVPAHIKQEGKLEVSIRPDGGRWKTVLQKAVSQAS
jgi:hypothetical protein